MQLGFFKLKATAGIGNVRNQFMCHTKILFGDLNAKVGREDIGNESLHKISNDNEVRLVNSATSKQFRVKSIMSPHRNIHK
jgi:hypothetical protein